MQGILSLSMEQAPLFLTHSFSVSDVTLYLRQVFESDELLSNLWVQGEISNLSRPSSGHIYFTLKDSGAALRCVIWRTTAQHLRVNLQNGLAVEAHGAVSLYERDGIYQLYIDSVRPAGAGWLYQEFLRLKERLEAEGLFDTERKRPLPALPNRIGIVTSPTGAALQDMLDTLRKRYPLARVILAPAAVQGDQAPAQLVRALKQLNRLAHPDVILLARGGGSLEDLWAFNDESVVRAVVASTAPVVSGVGHETDFTLVDFAADVRAPTPTGAAVVATPHVDDLKRGLLERLNRLDGDMENRLSSAQRGWSDLKTRLERLSPMHQIQNDRQRLDQLQERTRRALVSALRLQHTHLESLHKRMDSLSPLAVLKRGYAVVRNANGALVSSVRQVSAGDDVHIRMIDGSLDAHVTRIQLSSERGDNE